MKRLSADHEGFLRNLFESSAVQKFEKDRKLDVSFADAARFWGLTEKMNRKQIDEKLQKMNQTLFELYLITANADAETSSGRVVTTEDIRKMTDIHRFLLARYQRHLNLLRKRPGKS
jgi:hypothetical protein